jgi:hypothetical protein
VVAKRLSNPRLRHQARATELADCGCRWKHIHVSEHNEPRKQTLMWPCAGVVIPTGQFVFRGRRDLY